MNLSNKDLNYYFNNEVQMKRDETKKVKAYVYPKVEQILKYVHSKDERIGGSHVGVGSSFQGLKVKHADEFDFNILLQGLGKFNWSSYKPRLYNFNSDIDLNGMDTIPTKLEIISTLVPLPDPEKGYTFMNTGNKHDAKPVWRNSSDLEYQGDIIPFLVKKEVKDLMQQAIRDLDLREDMRQGRTVHEPALTLRIPCNIGKIEEVSVDLAPTIPSHMPFPSYVKWPRPFTYWPSKEKVTKITEQLGINFTAKKPLYWFYSFAACEGELMNEIDRDGGCRKKALRIMKRLREKYWCKGSNKPMLSSYHLKNIFFWECENHPLSPEWHQDKLSERIESMIRTLLNCIEKTEVSQYFYSDVNLLSVENEDEKTTLQNERQNIVQFLANPASFLLW